jgi:hypothetical protein
MFFILFPYEVSLSISVFTIELIKFENLKQERFEVLKLPKLKRGGYDVQMFKLSKGYDIKKNFHHPLTYFKRYRLEDMITKR